MARQKSVPKPNAQCGNEVGESQQRADVALSLCRSAHRTLHTAHCTLQEESKANFYSAETVGKSSTIFFVASKTASCHWSG